MKAFPVGTAFGKYSEDADSLLPVSDEWLVPGLGICQRVRISGLLSRTDNVIVKLHPRSP